MHYGTLTIKARIPLGIDGLDMGMSQAKSVRFKHTEEGFERNGKIYKTGDYQYLLEALDGSGWDIQSYSYKAVAVQNLMFQLAHS